MKLKSGLGVTLLAAYLLVIGIMGAFHVSLGQFGLLIPILALASGIALLMGK